MIEIRNCSKAFGEIHAIDHVLMEIGERQIFGIQLCAESCRRNSCQPLILRSAVKNNFHFIGIFHNSFLPPLFRLPHRFRQIYIPLTDAAAFQYRNLLL